MNQKPHQPPRDAAVNSGMNPRIDDADASAVNADGMDNINKGDLAGDSVAIATPMSANADASVQRAARRGAAGVFNQMREAIVNGEFHFNERLPSERDLARQFRAARGTIRAALLQLEHAALIRRKFGSGAFVAYNSPFQHGDIADQVSPLELIETRLAIEPHIVKLVVANANNRDLMQLEAALARVVGCKRDPHAFSTADEAFHQMLAHCSQNPMLIWMYKRINDIRAHSQWSQHKSNILSREKIADYNRQHAELLRLITRRDTDGAVRAMVEHLNQVKRDLMGEG